MIRRAFDPTPIPTAAGAIAVLTAAAFAALTLAAAAGAQGQPDDPFGEVIDVRVVNLEVVIVDGDRRVSGLGLEDLILTVDGAEVPIEYFTEVSGGTAVAKDDTSDSAALPALAPGVPVPTSYLVFVDEFYTVAAKRNRVLRTLIEQLPMLTLEDRMAVVAYDGRKLEMLSTWSQSVDGLTRIFQKAMDRPTFGAQRLNSRRSFAPSAEILEARNARAADFEEPGSLGSGFNVQSRQLTIEEEQLLSMLENDVERTVLAAASALRSFANPPGRKVMLLVAGGWPYTPAQWLINDQERSVYATGFAYGDNLYAPLIETANRLSYTLYPIDVPIQADTAGDAAQGAEPSGVGGFGEAVTDRQAALRRLAIDTGGRAIFAADTLRALENVVTDTRSYYWVGFTPDWRGDDEAHRVNIDVRRPGLRVRSRQSFSDLSREREVTMMVESALRLGDTPTTPMPARIGEITKAGRRKVDVPIRVLVPMEALTFLPHDGHYVARAELRLAAMDGEGVLTEIPVVPLTITLDAAPEKGERRRFETRITLRREKHDLIVSLYDNASGTILSTKLEIDPM